MKPSTTLLLTMLLIAANLQAQYFVQPLESVGGAQEVYVNTLDGQEMVGRMGAVSMTNGHIRSFTLKEESGVKHKFKAHQIQQIMVKPSQWDNVQSAFTASSVKELLSNPVNETMQREWVIFEQAVLPGKKNRFALLQLLNPGMQGDLKVYVDPNAKETNGIGISGIQLTGGKDKSYLVIKGGKKAFLIKKKNYTREAASLLYEGCPWFDQQYAGQKLKFGDFEEHVFLFDKHCN